MKLNANARLLPQRRAAVARRVICGELHDVIAAQAYGVSVKTVGTRVARFKEGGGTAVICRASLPARVPTQTDDAMRHEIIFSRRERLTGKAIAKIVGVHSAMVSRILRAKELSRESDREPKGPPAARPPTCGSPFDGTGSLE